MIYWMYLKNKECSNTHSGFIFITSATLTVGTLWLVTGTSSSGSSRDFVLNKPLISLYTHKDDTRDF